MGHLLDVTITLPPPFIHYPQNYYVGRSTRDGKQSSDGDTLSLLSFVVLDQLYREKSVESEEGRVIRQASMDLGVIDILLVCLASFGHQTPRFPELRETGAVPESVREVDCYAWFGQEKLQFRGEMISKIAVSSLWVMICVKANLGNVI